MGGLLVRTATLLRAAAVGAAIAALPFLAPAPARAALLGHWNFDEPTGVTVGSASGIAAPGEIQGGAAHVAGRFGGALAFDGTDDQVIVQNAANLFNSLSDQATISLWAYGGDAQPQSRTAFSAQNAGGGRVLQTHLPWGDRRVYWDAGNSYDRIDRGADTAEIKGQWNHWAFTKDAAAGVMRIHLNGELWQITAPSGASSAALGMPATQSSTSNAAPASRAVDGDTNGAWSNGSVTHTNKESQPWWEVDLGTMTPIEEVVLFNRTDCCSGRLSNFHVSVFDEGLNEVFRKDFFTASSNPSSSPIALDVGGLEGRYLRVQLNGSEVLSLAEVVVNGTPQPLHTLPMTGIESFVIGSAGDDQYWPGMIDDVAVWDEVLSDAQIAALAAKAVTISEPSINGSIVNSGGDLNPGGEGAIGTTELAGGNLALQARGSTATQSSNNFGSPTGYAFKAIDGDTNGAWNHGNPPAGSVTHTTNQAQPWWEVDLGTTATLEDLSLWNRTDCCGDRLSNFRVSVLAEDGATEVWGEDFFTGGGQPSPNLDITLPDGVRGRFVRVQLLGMNVLSLAEVQAYGGLDYTQAGDGVLAIDIDALADAADKLVVPGTLTLGGALQVSLLTGDPAPGSAFDVLDWGTLVGEFDVLNLPAFSAPGLYWETSQLYTEGVLAVAVPEPSSLVLTGLAALGLTAWCGQRRRAGRHSRLRRAVGTAPRSSSPAAGRCGRFRGA